MTDFRDRILKAFHVPADERSKTGTYTESIRDLMKRAGINNLEGVNTQQGHDNGFVMMVEENGRALHMPLNRRAQFLSGYPISAPILGDALFFSETWVDDGRDLVDLSTKALDRYLTNQEVRDGYGPWVKSPEVVRYTQLFS